MTGKEVFMYIGQPYSSVTGLYYFGARYYDPTIGRFITEDSYEGDDNDPMTLNRYIYGRDNPERYSDPNGHMFVVSTGGGGAVSPTCTADPAACTSVTSSTSSETSVVYADMYYTTYQKVLTTTTTTCFEGYCTSSTATGMTVWSVMNPSEALGTVVESGWPTAIGQCFQGVCGAATVAGGASLVAVGSGYAAGGAIAAGTATTSVSFFTGGVVLIGGIAFSAGFSIGYVIRHGTSSTPQGAWDAFVTPLSYLASLLEPHPEPPEPSIYGSYIVR
jgi:RHS repeat-associated protein